MMQTHDVNISIPQESANSNEIAVTGPSANVEEAIAHILKRVVEFEEAAEDRVSFISSKSINAFSHFFKIKVCKSLVEIILFRILNSLDNILSFSVIDHTQYI